MRLEAQQNPMLMRVFFCLRPWMKPEDSLNVFVQETYEWELTLHYKIYSQPLCARRISMTFSFNEPMQITYLHTILHFGVQTNLIIQALKMTSQIHITIIISSLVINISRNFILLFNQSLSLTIQMLKLQVIIMILGWCYLLLRILLRKQRKLVLE